MRTKDNRRRECIRICSESPIQRCANEEDSGYAQTETVSTVATNTTAKHHTKHMAATTTQLKQLTDKNSTTNDDCEDGDSRRSSSIDIEQSSNDDGSTNLNVNGNGEYDNALSKSKETRRKKKKKILVRNSDFGSFGSVKSVNVNIGNSTSRRVDSNGYRSLKGNHQYLHRRVRELEHFISTIGEDSTTAWTTVNFEQDTYDGQHNSDPSPPPSSNEHSISIDWVIVSLELERVSVCEYRFDDENRRTSAVEPESHPHQSSSTPSEHDTIVAADYGLFRSRNRTIHYLLWFIKLFDINIKTGALCPSPSPSSSPVTVADTAMKSTVSLYSSRYVSADSLYSVNDQCVELNYLMQHEPSCSQKMPSKGSADRLAGSPFAHSLRSSDTNIASPKIPSNPSIPEYFGLNDYGDIVIHVDHVCEEKGFGFKMHRKKSVYRKIVRGKEVTEKKYSFKVAMKRFFKEMISAFCECCRGEYKKTRGGVGGWGGQCMRNKLIYPIQIFTTWNVVQCIEHACESTLSSFLLIDCVHIVSRAHSNWKLDDEMWKTSDTKPRSVTQYTTGSLRWVIGSSSNNKVCAACSSENSNNNNKKASLFHWNNLIWIAFAFCVGLNSYRNLSLLTNSHRIESFSRANWHPNEWIALNLSTSRCPTVEWVCCSVAAKVIYYILLLLYCAHDQPLTPFVNCTRRIRRTTHRISRVDNFCFFFLPSFDCFVLLIWCEIRNQFNCDFFINFLNKSTTSHRLHSIWKFRPTTQMNSIFSLTICNWITTSINRCAMPKKKKKHALVWNFDASHTNDA